MNQKFYICKHCGNVIEKVEDKGVPVVCCGEVMKELQAGIEDAAFEKHIPVYTVEGDTIHVFVGLPWCPAFRTSACTSAPDSSRSPSAFCSISPVNRKLVPP